MNIDQLKSLGDADAVQVTGAEVKALAAELEKTAVEKALHEQAATTPIIKAGFDGEAETKKAKAIGKYLLANVDKNFGAAEQVLKDNVNILGTVQKANFNETTNAEGAFLVPSVWYNDIFSNVAKFGYARKLAKIFPMTAKTHKLNRGGSVTAGMVAEESAPTPADSSTFFAQTDLTAKRAAAAYLISRELLKDATPSVIEYMNMELGRAIAELEDTQFFKGSGSGANHTGLIGTSGVNVQYFGGASNSGKDTFAEVSWKDLTRVITANNSTVLQDGIFVIPQTIFMYLMQEVDGVSGRPIWNQLAPVDAAKYVGLEGLTALWTPIGRPAVIVPDSLFPSSAVTTTGIIFGDFSKYGIFGTWEEAELRTFNESYNGTALSGVNRTAIEISERFGVAFPNPSAFTLIKTSTT